MVLMLLILLNSAAQNSTPNLFLKRNIRQDNQSFQFFVMEDNADDKIKPGEAVSRSFSAGNLPTNIKKGLGEAWEKIKKFEDPWEDNSQNSPIHVLGSFNLSVRVNANGTTATVCIYDSKKFKSFSDGNASQDANRNRKDSNFKILTSTYQRYLWDIKIK